MIKLGRQIFMPKVCFRAVSTVIALGEKKELSPGEKSATAVMNLSPISAVDILKNSQIFDFIGFNNPDIFMSSFKEATLIYKIKFITSSIHCVSIMPAISMLIDLVRMT